MQFWWWCRFSCEHHHVVFLTDFSFLIPRTKQFTILLVGYFVLGPSDLYKLVKEIGKFIQNIRTLGTDLSTTFENNMESTLQLDELRKAQRELNDAFSFRRSINVDQESDAFSVQAGSAQQPAAPASVVESAGAASMSAEASTITTTEDRPKKIRRRVRRRSAPAETGNEASSLMTTSDAAPPSPAGNVPDLEMPNLAATAQAASSKEEAAIIDQEFEKYVSMGTNNNPPDDEAWFGDSRNESLASTSTSSSTIPPEYEAAAQNRFQAQLSGNWNEQVLAAGDKLEPMAVVMNKIALLEQEKKAALQRLEEEFAKRSELETQFYQEQRRLLEDAATQVQSAAFGLETSRVGSTTTGDSPNSKSKTKV